ncbi:hypothetical protein E2542_SST11757 [Spatholobus suberectus]|nr:hypothetical protein E2542_SST11757 [Spatholobus suberectus]
MLNNKLNSLTRGKGCIATILWKRSKPAPTLLTFLTESKNCSLTALFVEGRVIADTVGAGVEAATRKEEPKRRHQERISKMRFGENEARVSNWVGSVWRMKMEERNVASGRH